ncbi:winged helix-turn-helix domain-containing protein [Candidatus Bathyarchaeota archaeon]|nr:winged helix-turn-helix domain-containing protein [Candidatus Bathyarchaeota archaeon]MBL7079618.1 winged helix-turn-helix domain-containing protein [Candidatus Bathyarchaeota archaeon]
MGRDRGSRGAAFIASDDGAAVSTPNVDRLLTPNEEKVVRYVKKRGETSVAEIMEHVNLSPPTLSKILGAMCELEVLVVSKELVVGKESSKRKGRRKNTYRLWVAEEQPKSEYVREKPLTDEELLNLYPEAFKETITEKPTTVRETL